MKKKSESLQGAPAVIYARYSSHAQNDASIEQQVAKCTEYAERMKLKIVGTYADRAISGRSDRRPEFQKMMRDAQAGKFRCVVAWKSNRMGRNMLEAMMNDSRLSGDGIKTLYVEEDFGDSAAGRFALRNMMNVNQFYSENMAEDVLRGLYDNARQCKVNGSCPLGYRRGPDGKYEIDEPAAEIVREIFTRFVAGDTLASVSDSLNARGIPTSTGGKWGKNSYHSIFSNVKYIGVYTYGDVRVEDGIPPIITRELFEKAQARKERRSMVKGRRRDNAEYLLTGKLFCGHCGEHMVGMSGTSMTGATYYYYECRGRHAEQKCKKSNVRKDVAERLVADALKKYVLRDDVIAWIADSVMKFQEKLKAESRLEYYQDKLVEVKRSLDNIMKAIEAGAYSDTMSERMRILETEANELKGLIASERDGIPTVTRDQVLYYLESFRDGSVDDPAFRKALFDNFLQAAYLYDGKLKIIFNYAEGNNELDLPISTEDLDSPGTSSFFVSSASPEEAETNYSATVVMIGGMFVLTVYFDND